MRIEEHRTNWQWGLEVADGYPNDELLFAPQKGVHSD